MNIADNQFGENDDELIKSICKVFENPNCCGWFDLQYNGLYDSCNFPLLVIELIAIEKFMDALRLNKNCWKVKISLNRLSEDVAKEFT